MYFKILSSHGRQLDENIKSCLPLINSVEESS